MDVAKANDEDVQQDESAESIKVKMIDRIFRKGRDGINDNDEFR